MTDNASLRPKDQTVLQQIKQGNDDVQKITAATTLENHEVNYSLQKLENLGLIELTKPDGYITRTINGQKRTFQAPKQASLTDAGDQLTIREEPQQYDYLTHNELVEKVHTLEQQINDLENQLQLFRKQIQKQLD